jgi:hypothetical protein
MTFPVQKPGGWTDDIDTITGSEITNIDVNLSNAIDGGAGGAYTPSSTITIGGSGVRILNGVRTVMNGPVILQGAQASIQYRLDTTTISPSGVATSFTVDTSNDVYIASAECGAICRVAINISQVGFIAPQDGYRMVIKKFRGNPVTDVAELSLRQDVVAGPTIITLPALSALVPPSNNNNVSAEIVFNGATSLWEVVRCHEQCQP